MLSTFYIRNSDQVSKGSLDHPNRKFSNVYNLFSSPVLETFNVDLARRLPVLRILIFTTSTVTVTYYLYILGSRGEGPIWEPTGYEAPTEGGGRTYYMYLLVLPCANCNHITYYLFAVLFDGVFLSWFRGVFLAFPSSGPFCYIPRRGGSPERKQVLLHFVQSPLNLGGRNREHPAGWVFLHVGIFFMYVISQVYAGSALLF